MFALYYIWLCSLFVVNTLFTATLVVFSLALFHNKVKILCWMAGMAAGILAANSLEIFSNIIRISY